MNELEELLKEQQAAGGDKPTDDVVIEPTAEELAAIEAAKTVPPVDPPKDEEEEVDAELEAINEFKALVGYEGEIEDFSVPSIAKIVNDKVNAVKQEFSSLQEDEDIRALVEWKQKGYTLESFLQVPKVFDKTTIDKDVDGDDIIKYVYKTRGFSDDEVTDMFEVLNLDPTKKAAKLDESLNLLETTSKKEHDDYLASIKQEQTKAKEDAEKMLTVINTGELGHLTITDRTEVEKFKTYLNSGESKKVWQTLTAEDAATIEYLLYKKFQVSGFKQLPIVGTERRKAVQIVAINPKQEARQKAESSEAQERLLNKLQGK